MLLHLVWNALYFGSLEIDIDYLRDTCSKTFYSCINLSVVIVQNELHKIIFFIFVLYMREAAFSIIRPSSHQCFR